jgi:hypothetical protein
MKMGLSMKQGHDHDLITKRKSPGDVELRLRSSRGGVRGSRISRGLEVDDLRSDNHLTTTTISTNCDFSALIYQDSTMHRPQHPQ